MTEPETVDEADGTGVSPVLEVGTDVDPFSVGEFVSPSLVSL